MSLAKEAPARVAVLEAALLEVSLKVGVDRCLGAAVSEVAAAEPQQVHQAGLLDAGREVRGLLAEWARVVAGAALSAQGLLAGQAYKWLV